MATANRTAPRAGRRQRYGGLARPFGLLAAVALAIWAVTQGPAFVRNAVTATAVAARVGCSCRFVAGRPLADCRHDFESGMSLVMLSEDERTVTARVPLLARDSATFVPGSGCVLERWPD